tara:strand:+ start:776 stop:2065 length:1290 start_codon:yes stop_codon:yes gene_type:complete
VNIIKFKQMKFNISIIGLGYIGLPLAIEFSKYFNVIGFDIDKKRVRELNEGIDRTKETVIKKNFSKNIYFTNNIKKLQNSNVFIITVPTPVKRNNKPDLSYLKKASEVVASNLKSSSIVIYESTVYPGCTEEYCCPILERLSGLRLNKDFYLGYSPERINPGDNKHKLRNIVKIVSGSNAHSLNLIKKLYSKIIKAGLHVAESIKIAEAAKVIENIQRDINIAFINECSLIFKKLNINSSKVLKAAETKWNFIPFKPGLVGGHCIGVDPYYLTYKAKKIKYNPKVILAGRKINNTMSFYIAKQVVEALKKTDENLKKKKVLILGLSFKENCIDIRNSKVFDIINYLQRKKIKIDVYDPIIDRSNITKEYKINLLNRLEKKNYYDIIILAVPHLAFLSMGIKKIKKFGNKNLKIFDLKSVFSSTETYWQM